jgi:hypothetical protein
MVSQMFGQLGVAQQAADIDRLKTLGAYGDLERALTQQGIDARFADVSKRHGVSRACSLIGSVGSFVAYQ